MAAWLGRWTSADPLGIGADGPGLYNYTRGSPVGYTDPGGTDSVSAADVKRQQAVLNSRHLADETADVARLEKEKAQDLQARADLFATASTPRKLATKNIHEDDAHLAVQMVGRGEGRREGGTAATFGQMVANAHYYGITPNASDFRAVGQSLLNSLVQRQMDRAIKRGSQQKGAGPRQGMSSATEEGPVGGPYRTAPKAPDPGEPARGSTGSAALALPPGRGKVLIERKLAKPEVEFAQEILDHQGGVLIGQPRKNTPGIDATLDGQPIQLKATVSKSPTHVTSAAKEAGEKAQRAQIDGVHVYIRAPNVRQEAILSGPLGKVLSQQKSLASINVLTKDGWVRIIRP